MLDCDFYMNIFLISDEEALKCFVNFSLFKYIYYTVHSDFDIGNSSDSVNGPREVKVQRKCLSY